MITEIIVKEARQNGVNGFVFEEFKNVLDFESLPVTYKAHEPCFYIYDISPNELYVWNNPDHDHDPNKDEEKIYKIKDFISKEDFTKLISILKQAGQRLTDINKQFKENWISDKKIIIKI